MALVAAQIGCRLEQMRAESNRLVVGSTWIVDVQVQMHLLRAPERPVRRNVTRCQLYANPPLAVGVDNAVPCLVRKDVATQNRGPECALGMQVGCVEDDNAAQ